MKPTLTLLTFLLTLATATAQVPMLRWDDPNELGYYNDPTFRQASDIDGDGYPEIVFAHRDAGAPVSDIWVYSMTLEQPLLVFSGSIQEVLFLPGSLHTIPDMNGDGAKEYLFLRIDASMKITMEVRDGISGFIIWEVDGSSPIATLSDPIVSINDIDGDGVEDVLAVMNHPSIGQDYSVTFSGLDGSIIYEIHQSFDPTRSFSLGDVDNDGFGDFGVRPTFGSDFFIYSGATGTQIQFRSITADANNVRRSLVGVGDVDGDGLNDWAETWEEASIHPMESSIHFFTDILNPTEIGVYEGQRFDPSLGSTPIFAHDFDGDGLNDILIRSRPGFKDSVTLFSPMNGLIREWAHFNSPVPCALDADWDGDGFPDLLIQTTVAPEIPLLVASLRETITVSPPDISQSTGGTLTFTVDAGTRFAGRRVQLMAGDGPRRPFKSYRLLVPGGPTQMVGFPFAPTRVTRRIFDHRDTPELADWTNTLDSQGQAILTIDFAPGELSTSLIGRQLHFTAMIESPTPPYPETSTERISVQILP